MKKTIFYLMMLTFLIGSCSKKADTVAAPVTEKLSSLSKEVLSQPSISTMKQAYRLLSSDERYALWDLKLATILKNDQNKLNNEQRSIVLEFQTYLKEGYIQKMTTDANADEVIKQRMPIYEKAFSKKQLYFLMESPYFTEDFSIAGIEQNSILPSYVDPEGSNCECRLDIYCYAGSGSGGRCSEKGCKTTKDGCGFFGGSACLGKCVQGD
jgi:hypothetical protein